MKRTPIDMIKQYGYNSTTKTKLSIYIIYNKSN